MERLLNDSNGRTIWVADPHRGDAKCFVVRTDERLTAFLELGVGDSSSHFIRSNWAMDPGQPIGRRRLVSRARCATASI